MKNRKAIRSYTISNRAHRAAMKAFAVLIILCALFTNALTQANKAAESVISKIGLDQRLGETVPLDAVFRDGKGRSVRLGDYFGKKPVILALVYYKCPLLCNQVLNGLLSSVRTLKFDAGKEFEIVFVGIDPKETPDIAERKKRSYVASYNRPGAYEGWHFLTGEDEAIKQVASAVGYRYVYLPETGQYAHPAGIMVLTPGGKLGQYFYGIEYSPRDLKLALMESSENRIGSIVDQALLYCFAYDPATGTYGFVILRVLRVLGVITVVLIATYIIYMVRRERSSSATDIRDGRIKLGNQ